MKKNTSNKDIYTGAIFSSLSCKWMGKELGLWPTNYNSNNYCVKVLFFSQKSLEKIFPGFY